MPGVESDRAKARGAGAVSGARTGRSPYLGGHSLIHVWSALGGPHPHTGASVAAQGSRWWVLTGLLAGLGFSFLTVVAGILLGLPENVVWWSTTIAFPVGAGVEWLAVGSRGWATLFGLAVMGGILWIFTQQVDWEGVAGEPRPGAEAGPPLPPSTGGQPQPQPARGSGSPAGAPAVAGSPGGGEASGTREAAVLLVTNALPSIAEVSLDGPAGIRTLGRIASGAERSFPLPPGLGDSIRITWTASGVQGRAAVPFSRDRPARITLTPAAGD